MGELFYYYYYYVLCLNKLQIKDKLILDKGFFVLPDVLKGIPGNFNNLDTQLCDDKKVNKQIFYFPFLFSHNNSTNLKNFNLNPPPPTIHGYKKNYHINPNV